MRTLQSEMGFKSETCRTVFRTERRAIFARLDGLDLATGNAMNLYRSLGAEVGTLEALDLAQRLAVWHDAMVLHNRRAGGTRGDFCENDCPHVDAQALWIEALDVFGHRAHELGFLRTHGARAFDRPAPAPARLRV
jgi:hypothetical protein